MSRPPRSPHVFSLQCVRAFCPQSALTRAPSLVPSLTRAPQSWAWQQVRTNTRNISGRLFYRKRPLMIPKRKRPHWRSKWLQGAPQRGGICIKVTVRTPKKPNSGLRKIAKVRLSTGKVRFVYIPGIGHNLNTHSVVLVKGGRIKDCPGLFYRAIRGKYDLLPVKNRFRRRSLYGCKLPPEKKAWRFERLNMRWLYIEKDRHEFNKFKWMTWRNEDGTLREGPLEPDEPVPRPDRFNWWFRTQKERSQKAG
uniref:Ribosomal protein S12, mitochondrial n=1 Tax=Chromera velia CCMP2878 TaxID=1169474 RepID=A0A0G4HK86_9ALVE|eukprot:Cvel_28382.t1-p1 / transcript=Cvel_28382.t1 / gene=Cvel_28382 / organism=Chromera_velia_CCMP2878 / gene_product=30S ribosomal protein S12, putative / transcript_product=30S ribosomal protein S12, putative / location=Cvel_scaffold3704:2385-3134(+) / protein_length=250 / sequence_SO=supercontig / SO=protein_coding / is_pseudo=false